MLKPGFQFELEINDPYEKFQAAEMTWTKSLDDPSSSSEVDKNSDVGKKFMEATVGKLEKLHLNMVFTFQIPFFLLAFEKYKFGFSFDYYMSMKSPAVKAVQV